MNKNVKKNKKQTKAQEPQGERALQLEILESPRNIIIFFILLFFFIAFFYKPLAFDGLEVTGSDVVSGIGKTHKIKEFEKKTGEKPLWNPYMFTGMPIYQRYGPVVWSVECARWLNGLAGVVFVGGRHRNVPAYQISGIKLDCRLSCRD